MEAARPGAVRRGAVASGEQRAPARRAPCGERGPAAAGRGAASPHPPPPPRPPGLPPSPPRSPSPPGCGGGTYRGAARGRGGPGTAGAAGAAAAGARLSPPLFVCEGPRAALSRDVTGPCVISAQGHRAPSRRGQRHPPPRGRGRGGGRGWEGGAGRSGPLFPRSAPARPAGGTRRSHRRPRARPRHARARCPPARPGRTWAGAEHVAAGRRAPPLGAVIAAPPPGSHFGLRPSPRGRPTRGPAAIPAAPCGRGAPAAAGAGCEEL